MKKIALLIFSLMAFVWNVQAQDPTPQQISQQLKAIADARRADSLRVLALIDSLKTKTQIINNMQKQISDHEMDLQKADAGIKQFGRRLEVTDENRYRVIKSNVVYSVELFRALNQRLNTLDALNQLESYQQILVDLNNPANENLGFSYNKKVTDLIMNNIQTKKKNRLMELTNMVLNNPILKGVTSLTPILGIGNSIFGVVSSFAAQDDRISTESLQAVKDGLDKYSMFYGTLNEANATFQRNLGTYRIGVSNLHNKIKDFVIKNLKEGGFTTGLEQKPNESVGEYLSRVFEVYNREAVESYFLGLENKNKDSKGAIKYETLLKNNTALINMNKRTDEVIDIYKGFEDIYRQYVAMIEKNNDTMQEILSIADKQNLTDSKSKVTEQKEKLKAEKDKGIRSINNAININELKNIVERLDSFFPAL